MSRIYVGDDPTGHRAYLDEEQRYATHMHVIGGTRTGKSKFLEWLVRQDIREGNGLCVVDWHGTLYNDILRWCSYHDIGIHGDYRRLILINPSQPSFVTGFNPFVAGSGDVSVQVSRRVDATIRPWGVTNTDLTPTFNRICRLLYTFMIEKEQTLPNAATLLHFKNRSLRERAAEGITDAFTRSEWEELQAITKLQDWKTEVLSTKNRLTRFVGSKSIRRFMGLPTGNIDLVKAMDEGHIVLINLGPSEYLDREAARVFASLLLNEFLEIAIPRATRAPRGTKPRLFTLFLDEFQEYITEDIGGMLDQVLKGGLQMVLAHQHLGQFEDNQRLKESVFTNARIRAVFGGLSTRSASELAEEMFLPDLNTRQIKKAYYHTIHLYDEQTRTSRSHSSSRTVGRTSTTVSGETSTPVEGWAEESVMSGSFQSQSEGENVVEQDSEGETEVPVFVPIPVQELGSEVEWTREEKVSRVAEMLKHQQQRHCFIKFDAAKTQPLRVPLVREFGIDAEYLGAYEENVFERQGALPAAEVDRQLAESAARFIGTWVDDVPIESSVTNGDEELFD